MEHKGTIDELYELWAIRECIADGNMGDATATHDDGAERYWANVRRLCSCAAATLLRAQRGLIDESFAIAVHRSFSECLSKEMLVGAMAEIPWANQWGFMVRYSQGEIAQMRS